MRLFFLIFLLIGSLHAGTIRLYNDSPYQLRVVVRGSDGGYLGETVMAPQHYYSWTDANTQFGIYDRQKPESVTPYTVMWYCMDGGDYSVCTSVANGATVAAMSCVGARECGPRQKRHDVNPNKGQGEELYTPPEEEKGVFREYYPAPQ